MSDRRVIAHVDADAFYASVHLLEDPSLAGKPLVVAGSGRRSIVTTASYEARRFGVHSAMPATRARRLCPQAIFITPRFDLYRAYSRRAMVVMERYSDVIQPLSLDEAYLDITHAERPVRHARAMVTEIREATGLQYSVGIGPNKLCAKVLSDHCKPAAFNVASRQQCCELFANHPPRLLPGVGPKTAETLDAMGLQTIAALRTADVGALARTFGARRAEELQARARFEHDGRVETSRDPKSVSEETTFEHDVEDADELDRQMRALADELGTRLLRRGLRGRTVGIKVRLADFTTVTRARTGADYISAPDEIAARACEMLRDYEPPQPVRLLGVRIAGFDLPEEDGGSPTVGEQLRLPLDLARLG